MKLPDLNKRISELVDFFSGGIKSQFCKKLNGISQQRFNRIFIADPRTGKIPAVPDDILTEIINSYNTVSAEWLLTGSGSMLKNISENSENLSKQSENDLRISIDELINKKIEEAVMENLDKTITAIMDGMNRSNQQQNEHVEKILKIQSDENAYKFNVIIDAIREIIKDEDKEKFESKIVQLKTKIG